MKNRLYITVISSLILSGCGDSSKLTKPEFSGKSDVVQIAEQGWDKLLTACPGIAEYSSDLFYEGLSDWTYLDTPMSRVEVTFKVADHPSKIPSALRAWGHTCSYAISTDGSSLRIQKDLCVSICKGSNYSGNGSDYVITL
ncbi:hypothetical protein GCM10007938_26490 [Vibrio zhanjiangensis]|uniref:Lipoprotein n=1 Tax=Vibrio zhanjiangensis TaxID=1046128 RepID=A0ABQ6F2C3_9VIBR|nr:hypothetical protein [Vibrio zhanjiangensis]GLT18867.1 hypothetical protein GCM10007938_26490 [Vibrio zhanjiangensis]